MNKFTATEEKNRYRAAIFSAAIDVLYCTFFEVKSDVLQQARYGLVVDHALVHNLQAIVFFGVNNINVPIYLGEKYEKTNTRKKIRRVVGLQ